METDGEKVEMDADNSSDVVRGEDGNCSKRRKRKRQSSPGMDGILFKKSKTTNDVDNGADLIFVKKLNAVDIRIFEYFFV